MHLPKNRTCRHLRLQRVSSTCHCGAHSTSPAHDENTRTSLCAAQHCSEPGFSSPLQGRAASRLPDLLRRPDSEASPLSRMNSGISPGTEPRRPCPPRFRRPDSSSDDANKSLVLPRSRAAARLSPARGAPADISPSAQRFLRAARVEGKVVPPRMELRIRLGKACAKRFGVRRNRHRGSCCP